MQDYKLILWLQKARRQNLLYHNEQIEVSDDPDVRKSEMLLWTIKAFNVAVEKLATKVGAWRNS